MYIDNELSTAKREEVEMYVLQHPKLQKEFINLKQVILTPETISYGNKEDLYRTEKKRTVYMRPWRLAAAAIFIGACAVGFWLMNKPVQTNPVAVNQSTEIKTKQNPVVKPVDTVQQQIINKQEPVAQQATPSTQNKNATEKIIAKKKNIQPTFKAKENDVAEQHTSTQKQNIIHNKPIDQNNIVKQNVAPVVENNDVAIENSSIKPLSVQDNGEETTSLQADENTDNNNNSYKIYPVAYKEINTADDDNSLHVGAFDLNKNKVKNLFKKAKRLLSNKQDNLANDDGKLQVANFEIQTKQQ